MTNIGNRERRSIVFDISCLSVLLCNALINACVENPIVETNAGKVLGAKETGAEGDVFCAFRGIPYAKAPVGELRFKDPEPVEPWLGIKETTTNARDCAQVEYIMNKIFGSEDCLYLYVYARNIDLTVPKPVMVWIHGGGFFFGSGSDWAYGPDYFMSKDIVLVSFNYRVNVFGFLNVDDDVAPGNMGLKDQVLALKWVRDNIVKFGGDPDNVTIFGNSAGGASVHYLTMSSLAKGLYHRAIMQSGTIFNPWALQLNPRERALQLSKYLGHANKDPKSVVQFLRTVDTQKILKALKQMFTKEEKIQLNWHFGPSIDSKAKEPFLSIHPNIAASNGIHVPLIIGNNNREGLLMYKYLQNNYGRFDKEFEQLLHPAIKNILKEYGLTFERLRHIYFGNAWITNKNMEEVIDMVGDLSIVEGVQRTLKIQIEKASFPTYYYQYTYDRDRSILKVGMQIALSGACHTDETFSIFRSHFMEGKIKFPEKGSEKYKIIDQMNPTSNPTELVPFKWEPVKDKAIFEYLNICENLRMDTTPSIENKYTTH